MNEINELPSIVRNVMESPVITTDVNSSMREAAEIMSEKHIGAIVVVEKGKPVGIVTQRGLLRALVLHVFISFRPLI